MVVILVVVPVAVILVLEQVVVILVLVQVAVSDCLAQFSDAGQTRVAVMKLVTPGERRSGEAFVSMHFHFKI